MGKIGREFGLFGAAPLAISLLCLLGLVGGITDAEAFVPVYLIGLIICITVVAVYGFYVLFQALRWLAANVR